MKRILKNRAAPKLSPRLPQTLMKRAAADRLAARRAAALLLTACLAAAGLTAKAAPAASQAVKTDTFPFGGAVTMRGVFGSNDFYFSVSPHWDVAGATVHLDVTQSARLDPALSTLTVSLNGEPVSSLPLGDYRADRSKIDVPLPKRRVKTGVNSVRVQTYRRAGEKPCTDDVSPANWLTLNEGSAVVVRYADRAPAMKISEYPYPFYRAQQGAAQNTAVTVGSPADAPELAAALEVASAFGRYAGSADVRVQVRPLAGLASRAGRNLIFIGRSGHAPAEIRALFPAGTDFSSGAWFCVAPSPYDPGSVVMAALADRDADLARASQFLRNDSLVAQADVSVYHLPASVDVLTRDAAQGDTYTLSGLGYPGVYLYGPFRRTATFDVGLPKDRVLDGASRITLHFRCSENLDFSRSLVTAYLGGVPIGSKKLTAEKAGDDTLTLAVPADARADAYVSLKVAFDLEIAGQWCELRPEETPWAYLVGDSSLFLPTARAPVSLFQNLPGPFVSGRRWNDTGFVLPENPTADDLDLAGRVAVWMGSGVRSNHGGLRVSVGDGSPDRTGNLIVIGTPRRQPLVRSLNPKLFFKYDGGFGFFRSNEKKELLTEKSRTLASFQLLDSPYGKGAVLVLTAPDEQNLQSAVESLFTASSFGKLRGDGALIEPDGTAAGYRFKKGAPSAPDFWNGSPGGPGLKTFLLLAGLMAVLIVTALLLQRRRGRKFAMRFEKAPRNRPGPTGGRESPPRESPPREPKK